jgi:hypothetical protein
MIRSILLFAGLLMAGGSSAQRMYATRSVLAAGEWHNIAVATSGIHRIDAALMTRMGIRLPVPSASIRLFGNGGMPRAPTDGRQIRPSNVFFFKSIRTRPSHIIS